MERTSYWAINAARWQFVVHVRRGLNRLGHLVAQAVLRTLSHPVDTDLDRKGAQAKAIRQVAVASDRGSTDEMRLKVLEELGSPGLGEFLPQPLERPRHRRTSPVEVI